MPTVLRRSTVSICLLFLTAYGRVCILQHKTYFHQIRTRTRILFSSRPGIAIPQPRRRSPLPPESATSSPTTGHGGERGEPLEEVRPGGAVEDPAGAILPLAAAAAAAAEQGPRVRSLAVTLTAQKRGRILSGQFHYKLKTRGVTVSLF